MTFWQWFWLVVEVFVFFAYLMILFQIVADLFRDRSTGGFAKAAWIVLLVVLPVLGAIVYLLARGRGMTERAQREAVEAKSATDDYIRAVAGASPVQEIVTARELLTAGAITPDEFARLKARALAAT